MNPFILYKDKLKTPDRYLANLLQSTDVILLAENHAIKQNIDCLIQAIPALYRAGANYIGMEFGASEDQEALDRLVLAKEYDEDLARELIFNYNPIFPYKEYQLIYKAVWLFNRALDKNELPLKILNLSYKYNWTRFTPPRTPSNMKRVFYKGGTEHYRFNLIKEKVILKKKKMVAIVGNVHAYTKYKVPVFDYLEENFVRFQDKFLGNLLYHHYGEKVKTVFFHDYVESKHGYKPITNGKLEHDIKEAGLSQVGFDLNTPLGNYKEDSYLAMGYNDFRLKNLADGYIFHTPLSGLKGATLDYDFLKGKTLEDVLKNYPDKDWHAAPNTLDEYWAMVTHYVDLDKRYFSHKK